ncbi:hypothetical protein RSSM_03001 [Rhodopirellula sallentina SM41]|uniref:Uncharacterized protein n=1 Tax=Rhodopirellula sallentina SM41 TaxID=1263870 RepID=M5UCF7_9BACT|nr:hypothetical protein RSSM_03001 [Rhodopirellula sallentina SM41]
MRLSLHGEVVDTNFSNHVGLLPTGRFQTALREQHSSAPLELCAFGS